MATMSRRFYEKPPKRRKKRKLPPLTSKQKARRKRAEKAAIRLIARQEGITQKEARRKIKDGIIEIIFERPKRYAQRRFIEISPRKFREVPPGKPFRETEATGPVRTSGYVRRIIKLKRYWEFVKLISEEQNLSIKAARKQIKKGVINIEDIYKFYFVPKGEKTA